jgi:hypothetical protein
VPVLAHRKVEVLCDPKEKLRQWRLRIRKEDIEGRLEKWRWELVERVEKEERETKMEEERRRDMCQIEWLLQHQGVPPQEIQAIMLDVAAMEWWEREEQIDILREVLGLPPEERE